jgi:hypothetical protein
MFEPSEFGVLDKYSLVKEIYKVQLSPTIITLAENRDTHQVRPPLTLIACLESDPKKYHEEQVDQ